MMANVMYRHGSDFLCHAELVCHYEAHLDHGSGIDSICSDYWDSRRPRLIPPYPMIGGLCNPLAGGLRSTHGEDFITALPRSILSKSS